MLQHNSVQSPEPDAPAKEGLAGRLRRGLFKRLDQRRLFRTSAFRLALIYAMVFSTLSAATLGFIYWSTRDQIELQVDARLRLETDYLINLYKSGAMPELLEAIQRRNQIDTYGRFYYLANSDMAEKSKEKSTDAVLPLKLKSVRSHTTRNMGDVADLPPGSPRAFNPVRVAETQLSDGLKLTIGHEISDEQALLDHTFTLVVGATGLTLLFSLIGGLWIGTSVLRRIDSVSRTASEIMSGDLSQRLRVTARDDEFDEISTKLNQMLNRIEDLMKSMQQVTNNVAHDLRSPLTRLRNRLEVTLLEERDPDVYRVVMDEAIGDADSLIHTFNAMLSIARLEAGIDSAQWKPTRMGDLAGELAELYEAVAEEEGQLTFRSDINSNPTFQCNRHLIGQALTNLLDNAIKYTPKGGQVRLRLEGNSEAFSITVSDNGPGIAEAERERVFERFVRLENERNSPGNGLGLSLVKAVIRLHSAKMTIGDSDPGNPTNPGLKISIHFTRKAAAEKHAKDLALSETRA
ncbi:sensor histidine kinase [Granulosicoccus antarcticus]|uniref:histidine kinase n=1 Tax=Granulosicoccus antarcticus IMCC3135 TaxID=1192854 RepID=A0A2Z2NNR0_9GAMM|nr:HAMP domain-containing sensor histidine kinase [Granulosicoccus antarcticus]ASJ70470.1 Sensor kinase CusS [Granulosicoccus antarcticus IMCC3135]